jgi:nitrogen fixation protein FixH
MKRGAGWPIAIAGILGTTVAANIWVMVIANDDPSFAIEPNYYAKAITWDSTLARARESDALGWRLTPTMGAIGRDGRARLTARLRDASGAPIEGAIVRVLALSIARASDVHEATLAPSEPGDYAVDLDTRRTGQWELRFVASLGADRFTQTDRVEAYAAR